MALSKFTKLGQIGGANDVKYQEMSDSVLLLLNISVLWYGHYHIMHVNVSWNFKYANRVGICLKYLSVNLSIVATWENFGG